MREEQIFHEILEQAAEKRAAFLADACGADAELRQRVEALLQAQANPGSFLQVPAPGHRNSPTIDQPHVEIPGTMIGPYKLLQQIGEGGMGTVYMAEQAQPVQRKVALKVIKAGMDSKQVIARFEAERQALAVMDHVNIARVLDAGTTESGLPYFVMELVHGVPITKYCDDNHLTPRQRLELFVPVCQAIQHAHQKGIIHRDIKPSNVMITLYDGKPVPKVIDFGVAKATEQKLTERTLFTQFGTMVGTLEYMSPEQAERSALGVDTRSDIYSLGVLLYELLTGSTPLSHKRVKEAAYAEVLRLIKDEEPPRPSTRLSDSGEALASISANRHMEPAKLTKLVRGELDWIVMKTLEKDRNRRYETANGFAQDVQRYLNDETVQACPPSSAYRLRKFAGRNRVAISTAALVLAALVVGTFVSTWQAIRAIRAEGLAQTRLEAETEARRLADEALQQAKTNYDLAEEQREAADHQRQQAEDAKKETVAYLQQAREAVDLMLTRVAGKELNDQPNMQRVKRNLLDDALKFYQGFLQQNSTDPSIRAETGMAYFRIGEIDRYLYWDRARAKEPFTRAISLLEQAVVDFPAIPRYREMLGRSYNGLGCCLAHEDRPEEAVQAHRRALDQFAQLLSPSQDRMRRQELAWTYLNLGRELLKSKQTEQSEEAFREVVDLCEKLEAEFPNESYYSAWIGNACLYLTRLLADNGEPQEADKFYRKLSELSPGSALSQNSLAWVLVNCSEPSLRNPGRAVQLARKAVEREPMNGQFSRTLGIALYRAGEWKDAIDALKKSNELLKGDAFSFNAFLLAMAHWQLEEKDEARQWYEQAVEWMEKNNQQHEDLKRFRDEAAELLAMKDK